jgi:glycosyltransferase involved in cell wall biosynthesis
VFVAHRPVPGKKVTVENQSRDEGHGTAPGRPLKVAWFSHFPIEWLPDLPPELRGIPRMHPATWQRVLWEEFANWPNLELHVIALRGAFPRSHTFRRVNTTFCCIRTPPGSRSSTLYWLDTLLVRRELKRIRPDLVHAWGTEYGSAAIAGRLSYPALITMQGILTWYGSVFPLNRHMKLSRWLEDRSLRRADVVTCESSFGKKYLADRYPHLELLQAEHAPHPIFSALRRVPQVAPLRILCVGSFLYWKGADIVVKALDQLKETEFELIWVGAKSPEFEEQLRRETSAEIWKRIQFKLDLTPNEVADELAKATFLVHASRADNSPNSVKEAVVAAVPVVATNTGGIPDYVIVGENGFLFEAGNVDDCTAKIRAALSHPDFSKGEVNAATLQRMRAYLSARTMAEKFYAAYQVALQEDRRANPKSAEMRNFA